MDAFLRSPRGSQRAAARCGAHPFDSVKDRPLAERCLVGFGSTSGPPMLPVLYNNNYQIVQTPDTVMILIEMVHDARIVRMNGTHRSQRTSSQWLGDSIGHWEGDTLVVDTTNFTNKTRFRGSSENLHVIERFTRVDANTILYRATIDDPYDVQQASGRRISVRRDTGTDLRIRVPRRQLLDDRHILGGARKAEAEATKKKKAQVTAPDLGHIRKTRSTGRRRPTPVHSRKGRSGQRSCSTMG